MKCVLSSYLDKNTFRTTWKSRFEFRILGLLTASCQNMAAWREPARPGPPPPSLSPPPLSRDPLHICMDSPTDTPKFVPCPPTPFLVDSINLGCTCQHDTLGRTGLEKACSGKQAQGCLGREFWGPIHCPKKGVPCCLLLTPNL